jgi:hypothetical protein
MTGIARLLTISVLAAAGCIDSTVGDVASDGTEESGEAAPGAEEDTDETTGAEPGTETIAWAGLCALAQHGNYHLVANKFARDVNATATRFDMVRGDAYVRDLDICIGASAGQGGSWVLPANVEGDSGEIYQLGYGRAVGRGSNYFVYALGSPLAVEITGVTPIAGHRYRFEITKRATFNTVSFKITDLSTSPSALVWSWDTNHPWASLMNHAWWGYETWDSFSTHGVRPGKPGVGMAYMGYRANNESTVRYLSDMTCSDIWKNFTWDGSTGNNGCTGKRRAVLGTWVYGGDRLDGFSY